MFRLFLSIICLFFFSEAGVGQTKVEDTVFRVRFGRSSGSCVVVGAKDGKSMALTAKHVVDGQRQGLLTTRDGQSVSVKLIASHERHDVSLIAIDADLPSSVLLAKEAQSRVGMWKIGYPAVGGRQDLDYRQGQLLRTGEEIDTSAIARPGDSGGGFFDDGGYLIGIVTQSRHDFTGATLGSRGVSASVCRTFVQRY